jgi:hypothetical protein
MNESFGSVERRPQWRKTALPVQTPANRRRIVTSREEGEIADYRPHLGGAGHFITVLVRKQLNAMIQPGSPSSSPGLYGFDGGVTNTGCYGVVAAQQPTIVDIAGPNVLVDR